METIFNNRLAVLVTKHGKEQVIEPLLRQEFNINLQVAGNVDTDLFGTFSGEVERLHNQYDTAKLKINAARQLYADADLFLASEGSFNPHPEAPVITVNTELILLVDLKNDVEIAAWYKTYNTNIENRKITTAAQLIDFAKAIDFPDNRIILKAKNANGKLQVAKGANTMQQLAEMFDETKKFATNGIVEAETDMRACYNTLRMESIRLCAINLINAMHSQCNQCGAPGFSVAESKPGLPCEQCGMPTKSILYYVYQCKKCSHKSEVKYPLGKMAEDPMYCDFCNP
jgi:ribosomal protein L37E